VLLKVDADGPNWSDMRHGGLLLCPVNRITLRQRFGEQGLEAALERKKRDRPPRAPILDGE